MKEHQHDPESITEETRVKVRLGTAWGVVVAIIGTTVWLTAVLVKVQHDNQTDHTRLMNGLTELNVRSKNWVTHAELEDVLVSAINEIQPVSTNEMYAREYRIREVTKRRLSSPKDYFP